MLLCLWNDNPFNHILASPHRRNTATSQRKLHVADHLSRSNITFRKPRLSVPVNNYFDQITTYPPPPSLQQGTPEDNHFEPQHAVPGISSRRSYYSYQTPTTPATSTATSTAPAPAPATFAAGRLSSPSPIGTDCYFSTSTPKTDLRLGHPTCTHILSATDT
jgi:hypothetical protein